MTADLIQKAKDFAINAHNSVNQRRKYTDEPYHVHPERVAALVASVSSDPEMIAAAWMHDVLEDVAPHNPAYNEAAIREQFGERVLQLVLELTDVSKPTDGNRSERKAIDRAHSATASVAAKTVKLADLIDNCTDIAKHDIHFAIAFRREAALLLPLLREGDKSLYEQLSKLLATRI